VILLLSRGVAAFAQCDSQRPIQATARDIGCSRSAGVRLASPPSSRCSVGGRLRDGLSGRELAGNNEAGACVPSSLYEVAGLRERRGLTGKPRVSRRCPSPVLPGETLTWWTLSAHLQPLGGTPTAVPPCHQRVTMLAPVGSKTNMPNGEQVRTCRSRPCAPGDANSHPHKQDKALNPVDCK
jgi:hypothetical protein